MTQLSRVQETIFHSDFDAMIISSELNLRYLSDFSYTDGYMLISASCAYLITDARYIEAARATVKEFKVVLAEDGMMNTLLSLITKEGYRSVAIEESALSCKGYDDLRAKLPEEISIVRGASAILLAQRAVKLPYEIDRIAKAQSITDSAFTHILQYITPSVSEADIALELEFFMRRQGAEATAFETIAVSGCSSSRPHGTPSSITVRNGFLTMDFGAKFNGYCSDMTRTIVIGRADEEMKRVYNTVLDAQKAALETIHGTMSCRAADEVARSLIRNAGYGDEFSHSLGHGVGMFIHESPSLSAKAPEGSVLCPGNVVTIEPGIYLEGRFGCRIEDMVMINPDGTLYNFTKSPKELIEL